MIRLHVTSGPHCGDSVDLVDPLPIVVLGMKPELGPIFSAADPPDAVELHRVKRASYRFVPPNELVHIDG